MNTPENIPTPPAPSAVGASTGVLTCKHCRAQGTVTKVSEKGQKSKQPIAIWKVVAAFFTGGISLFFTGLRHTSHRAMITRLTCSACGITETIAG